MTFTDHDPTQHALATRWSPTRWAPPVVIALALLVDAVVHLHLASRYQLSAPGGIGAGNLFRLQSVIAAGAAVWVMLAGTRRSYITGFLVAASALGAVILYRYVNVPMLGPLPAMYEPVWFTEKTLSAVAEAVAAVVAGLAVVSGSHARVGLSAKVLSSPDICSRACGKVGRW